MGNCVDNQESLTEIDEFLYLGGYSAAVSEEVIGMHGIQHVVQLFVVEPPRHVKRLEIPIRGGRTTNIEPVLKKALAYIEDAISQKQTVLVHCKHGRNRSASIVIAYLMAKKQWDFETAFNFVYSKRPILRIKPKVKEFLNKIDQGELNGLLENN